MKPPVNGDDLESALEGFEGAEGSEALRRAIKQQLQDQLQAIDLDDLTIVPDEDLATIDSVAKSRLTYCVSLIRLCDYLRKQPGDWDMATKQASLALKYVQHCEARGLKALQLGRAASDEVLAAEIDRLRAQIQDTANERAQIQLTEGSNGETP